MPIARVKAKRNALDLYLIDTKTSNEAFGRLINGVSGACVKKWRKGQAMPRPESRDKIKQVTGGKVPPESFL